MSDDVPRTPGTASVASTDSDIVDHISAAGRLDVHLHAEPQADSDIVARISAAVHEPFAEVWRRYEADVWLPVRRVLEEAAGAHERALAALSAGNTGDASDGDGGREGLARAWSGSRTPVPSAKGSRDADGGRAGHTGEGNRDARGHREQDAPEALARYRDVVSDEVIEPLRAALAGSAAATALEESLASTAAPARVSAAGLPAMLRAPVSRSVGARVSRVGPVRAIKRAAARVLGPMVWRGRMRRVPVAGLARQHLDQVVLRAQADAFLRSQHDRAEWLGRLERAWAAWAAAVLDSGDPTRASVREVPRQPVSSADEPQRPFDPAAGEERPHDIQTRHAAGRALQAELKALIDEVERAAGAASSAGLRRLQELLAASIAVAGTFAADPPSSRPGPGRQRELAVQWDAWAEGAAARLALYRNLATMRRDIEGIFGELRGDWSRTVRNADSVLAQVAAELSQARERTAGLSVGGEDLAPILEAERQRTQAALAHIQGGLPEPDAVFETLTATVEDAIHGLDEVRERLPGTLALHDLPAPADPPRRPTADPRAVRLRDTFLHTFDLLRRERMRAAPAAIRESMHRIRSEVAELREVSEYGYEAAVAEAKDRRDPDDPDPVALVVNGLSRAGNKVAAARELLSEALVTAQSGVAAELGRGSRQLIEQVTADRMTAGYLEARTVLSAGFARVWKRMRRLSAQAAASAAAAASWALGFLRPLSASISFGPAARTVVDRRDKSLAYADEYPRTLPVVYRRLFSLEPLADARLLAGRGDALAAMAAAWARRATGEARCLVVIASPGAGVTSFLNVVTSRLSEEAPGGVRRRFATRLRTEAHLAGCLAGWLGLGDAGDLDSLADRVLEAVPGSVPGFAVLEATEHLHMRAPGGGRLFERLLTFMSRTESRVFWVAAITSTAWQLVERRAPAFVRDIERVPLRELSPEALRQAILARHRLSGLPLRFAEPHDRGAVLRRRARRLRGSGKQEGLVESDYFQRLHRVARGSPRLALFHWLRSADFATADGSLLVQPLNTLDPGVGNLDRVQSFALKAILDHGTLTVDEYRDVARIPGPESLHILRSLEECRVIEKVPAAAWEKPPAEKAAGDGPAQPRYRIRPLMIGAVAAQLRSSNILH